MSVLEELRAVEERIVARLKELQPVVEEYEELQRVAERLGIDVPPRRQSSEGQDGHATAPSGVAARPSRDKPARGKRPAARTRRRSAPSRSQETPARQPGGTRAKGAERREQVVALIRERPGITVPDVSQHLGLEPPPVYRVIRKLQSAGVVVKEGKQLRLA